MKQKTQNPNLFTLCNTSISFREGESVLEAVLRAKVPLYHSCGGMGSCGTCLVHVLKSHTSLAERNSVELEMALDRGFSSQERLACQLEAIPGLILEADLDLDGK